MLLPVGPSLSIFIPKSRRTNLMVGGFRNNDVSRPPKSGRRYNTERALLNY